MPRLTGSVASNYIKDGALPSISNALDHPTLFLFLPILSYQIFGLELYLNLAHHALCISLLSVWCVIFDLLSAAPFSYLLTHGIVAGAMAIPGHRLPRSVTAISEPTTTATIITEIISTTSTEPSSPLIRVNVNNGTDELDLGKWAKLL
jgi:hypothetical protein